MHDSDWEAAAHIGIYKKESDGQQSHNWNRDSTRAEVGVVSRINYGGIDMDVVVKFKSEGASNKIQ